MSRPPKVVEVIWEDAWYGEDNVELTKKEIKQLPPVIVRSSGYLCQNNKRGVGLATSFSYPSKSYRHVKFIPRGSIRSFVVKD